MSDLLLSGADADTTALAGLLSKTSEALRDGDVALTDFDPPARREVSQSYGGLIVANALEAAANGIHTGSLGVTYFGWALRTDAEGIVEVKLSVDYSMKGSMDDPVLESLNESPGPDLPEPHDRIADPGFSVHYAPGGGGREMAAPSELIDLFGDGGAQ